MKYLLLIVYYLLIIVNNCLIFASYCLLFAYYLHLNKNNHIYNPVHLDQNDVNERKDIFKLLGSFLLQNYAYLFSQLNTTRSCKRQLLISIKITDKCKNSKRFKSANET